MTIPPLLGVTPFGVYCTKCNIPLPLSKGAHCHLVSRHPQVSSSVPGRRQLAALLDARLSSRRHDGTEAYLRRAEDNRGSKKMYFCRVCYLVFDRLSNYERHSKKHCGGTTTKVWCHPTICGRMGPVILPHRRLVPHIVPDGRAEIRCAGAGAVEEVWKLHQAEQALINGSLSGILPFVRLPWMQWMNPNADMTVLLWEEYGRDPFRPTQCF